MINIRQNIFETNSSSTHSISISSETDGILDTIIGDEYGCILIPNNDFGQEWVKYNDPITKIQYCMTDQKHRKHKLDMLRKVVFEHTGCELILPNPITGYIDHQSNNTSYEVFCNEKTLKEFLFNPASYVFLGNDNEKPPYNFYDVENIEYEYELIVNDTECEETAKFLSYPEDNEITKAIECIVDRNYYGYKYYNEINDINGNIYTSLYFDKKIIILYDLKSVYIDDVWAGYKIDNSKQLTFEIKKI